MLHDAQFLHSEDFWCGAKQSGGDGEVVKSCAVPPHCGRWLGIGDLQVYSYVCTQHTRCLPFAFEDIAGWHLNPVGRSYISL